MKCLDCNKDMTVSKEVYHYTESGLDSVYLDNVEVYRCECGEEFASIPAIIELNSVIGLNLVKKKTYLNGSEIQIGRAHV